MNNKINEFSYRPRLISIKTMVLINLASNFEYKRIMNSFFHPCCQKRQTNHEYNCLSMLSNKIRQLSPAVKINLQNQLYKTLSRLISTKTEVLINLPCKYGKNSIKVP